MTPFVIEPDGSCYYLIGGEKIPREEVEKANELPVSFREYNNSADSSNSWMVSK